MRLFRLVARVAYTGVRLPFAIAWDAVRLPAIAADSPSSTVKVLDEHAAQKELDDFLERNPRP